MLQKVDSFITKLLETIITLSLTVTVGVTFLQVFFRFVVRQPLSWSQEIVMISFVYSILFGAALAFKNAEHLTVDIFENAKEGLKKGLNALSFIVVLVMIGVLFYYGIILVSENLQSGQIIGFLPIKKAYIYMALPVSSLFMLYYHVKKVFK